MQRRANAFKALVDLYGRNVENLHPFDNLGHSMVAIEWYRVIRCIEQFMSDHKSKLHLCVASLGLLKLLSDEADRLEALKLAPSQYLVWKAAVNAVTAIG